jgi:CRP-like cAMP-binding protein
MMQSMAIPERRDVNAPRPIAELLACPPEIGSMLNATAVNIEFDAGDILFHQDEVCRGLYLPISGYLLRKASRRDARLTLGTVRAGEVVELAAMLGDVRHTYTLIGQSRGAAMRLPKEALLRAFDAFPTLKMRLLEELAREVSRAYGMCCVVKHSSMRSRPTNSSRANAEFR